VNTLKQTLLAAFLILITLFLLSCGTKENAAKVAGPKINALPADGILIISGNPVAAQYLTEGWYPTQLDVAWSNGDSKIWLAYDSNQLKTYKGVALSLQAAVASLPIDAILHTGGRDYTFPVSNAKGQATAVVEVPIQADAAGHQEITLTTSKRVVPAQFGLGPDQRTLGVGLSKIQLVQAINGQ